MEKSSIMKFKRKLLIKIAQSKKRLLESCEKSLSNHSKSLEKESIIVELIWSTETDFVIKFVFSVILGSLLAIMIVVFEI